MKAALLAIALLCASAGVTSAADHAAEVSAYRRSRGLSVVKTDATLTAIAQRQAATMARAGEVSHDADGSFSSRVSGLGRVRAAENVAAGKATFAATLQQWDGSSGHKQNLLMPGATRIGVGAATNSNSRYKTFWALVITN